jgi:CRP-like cAMP-binding protein
VPDFDTAQPAGWADLDVTGAIAESSLDALSAAGLEELLASAYLTRHAAGTQFLYSYHNLPSDPPGLVVDGLLRVFRRDPDGRETTARYVNLGDLVGLTGLLASGRQRMLAERLNTDVVHATAVLRFDPAAFERVFDSEPAFARSLCRYLFARLLITQETLTGSMLLPVRARVAGHLLDLAERCGSELLVTAKPRRLAAASGSVREVVSRILRDLEREGVLKRDGSDRLRLVDTAALHRIARGQEHSADDHRSNVG